MRVEIISDRDDRRGLTLNTISLNIETNENTNRWVIVEDLLTLDAIDFSLVITNPEPPYARCLLRAERSDRHREKAAMRLTGDLSHAGGDMDYGFTGHLLEDEPLHINEVLTHFLAHSDYPSTASCWRSLLSVRPRSKLYRGEIKLSANWALTEKLSLRGVYFRMDHGAGAGDTIL